jgi:hypothetical protein
MLGCEQVRELAGELLEGGNHPDVYAHLMGCPRCRRLVEEVAAIEQAARSLPAVEPRPELWLRLKTAAEAEGLWEESAWRRLVRAWQSAVPLPMRPVLATGLMAAVAIFMIVGGDSIEIFSPAESAAPTVYEVARGELVQEMSFPVRYQVHLDQVQSEWLEEVAEVDSDLEQLAVRPLETLDHAIGETQLRLASYPEDSLARTELLRLYRQKATVLQAMNAPAWQDLGY